MGGGGSRRIVLRVPEAATACKATLGERTRRDRKDRSMDRALYYLQSLPPWLLPVGLGSLVIGSILFALFVPSRLQVAVITAVLPPALLANQFTELAAVQGAAKVLSFALYLGLIAVLLTKPPVRKVSPLAWGFVGVGLLGMIFVSRCSDGLLAMYINLMYAVMAFSSILLVARVSDAAELRRICVGVTFGFLLSTLVLASGVLLDPRAMQHVTTYRFSPWGTNPNIMMCHPFMMFICSLYVIVSRRNTAWTAPAYVACGVAFGLLALTASRSAVLLVGLTVPAMLLPIVKKPVVTAIGVVIAIGIVGWLAGKTEQGIVSSRFTNFETTRWEIAAAYIESIKQRPILGAFTNPGMNSVGIETTDTHSHNTWLLLAHRGGLVYAGYYTLLALASIAASILVTLRRHDLGVEPRLGVLLATLTTATYIHGVVNFTNVWPTNFWGFTQVTLSCLMLSWAGDLLAKRTPCPAVQPVTAYGSYSAAINREMVAHTA